MQVLAVLQLVRLIIAQIKLDNGSEYTSNNLKAYFCKEGIKYNLVLPYYYKLNSVLERFN
jgi:hypothetical protein